MRDKERDHRRTRGWDQSGKREQEEEREDGIQGVDKLSVMKAIMVDCTVCMLVSQGKWLTEGAHLAALNQMRS